MAGKDQEKRPLERVSVQTTPSVYANNAEIRFSNWDFRITFGEIESAAEGKISVAERVRIVMSPQHAKAFSQVLVDQIEKYEKAMSEVSASKED